MIVELFSEPLHRRYFASRLSCAYLFTVVCKVVIIILPFLLSYRNGKIWLKHEIYYEQPDVQFTYKLILVLQTTSATNGSIIPHEIFYSTIPDYNRLRSNNDVRIPIIRSREVDGDNDGIMDCFKLNALIPLLPHESVYEIQAILIFDFKIKQEIDLEFDTLAYVHHTSGIPSSSLYSVGQINLKQSKPFTYRESVQEELLPLDDMSIKNSIKESNLHAILENFSKRHKQITKYEELYVTTKRSYANDEDRQKLYNLTLHVNVPNYQEILYEPGIIEVTYYAWIRYLSLLIIVGYLLRKICSFIFYYQIVSTATKDDIAKIAVDKTWH